MWALSLHVYCCMVMPLLKPHHTCKRLRCSCSLASSSRARGAARVITAPPWLLPATPAVSMAHQSGIGVNDMAVSQPCPVDGDLLRKTAQQSLRLQRTPTFIGAFCMLSQSSMPQSALLQTPLTRNVPLAWASTIIHLYHAMSLQRAADGKQHSAPSRLHSTAAAG